MKFLAVALNCVNPAKIFCREHQLYKGVPTPDAATFRKIWMSKQKNRDILWGWGWGVGGLSPAHHGSANASVCGFLLAFLLHCQDVKRTLFEMIYCNELCYFRIVTIPSSQMPWVWRRNEKIKHNCENKLSAIHIQWKIQGAPSPACPPSPNSFVLHTNTGSAPQRKILFVYIPNVLPFQGWVPAIFVNRALSDETEDNDCDYAVSASYVIVSCILIYYLPIVLMVYLYSMLYYKIKIVMRSSITTEKGKDFKHNFSTEALLC